MDCEKTGALIRLLRQEQHLTQEQLAARLNISNKTVSKWERGAGCPDISLLDTLADALQVDLRELLQGRLPDKPWATGNMKKAIYYVCPVCGSLSVTTGNASLSCCGRTLAPLSPAKAAENQRLQLEAVEDEWFITSTHPMEKNCYISFVAFVTGDRLQLVRQYPEWELQLRLPKRHGQLLWYSTQDGLLTQTI